VPVLPVARGESRRRPKGWVTTLATYRRRQASFSHPEASGQLSVPQGTAVSHGQRPCRCSPTCWLRAEVRFALAPTPARKRITAALVKSYGRYTVMIESVAIIRRGDGQPAFPVLVVRLADEALGGATSHASAPRAAISRPRRPRPMALRVRRVPGAGVGTLTLAAPRHFRRGLRLARVSIPC